MIYLTDRSSSSLDLARAVMHVLMSREAGVGLLLDIQQGRTATCSRHVYGGDAGLRLMGSFSRIDQEQGGGL